MAQIRWNKSAIHDLNEIGEFLSQTSLKAAKKEVIIIFNKAKILAENPLLGRVVPEFEIEHIREIIFRKYRLIYRIKTENQIEILMIHHTSRDLSKRSIDQK